MNFDIFCFPCNIITCHRISICWMIFIFYGILTRYYGIITTFMEIFSRIRQAIKTWFIDKHSNKHIFIFIMSNYNRYILMRISYCDSPFIFIKFAKAVNPRHGLRNRKRLFILLEVALSRYVWSFHSCAYAVLHCFNHIHSNKIIQ